LDNRDRGSIIRELYASKNKKYQLKLIIMKKLTLALFVFGFSLTLSVTGQSISSQKKDLSGIDEFIIEQMEIFHVPGLSACIIIGDSVVWNSNYGFMNLEDSIPVSDSTLFNVFSIGKSLTSACVMQLWDKQFLGLDQNINDFLPFQIENPWNDADSITARMLMSHSSSINNGNIFNFVTIGDPTIQLEYFLENYLSQGGQYYSTGNYYNAIPGTVFHYDNYGIALNGYLIEPLTGISFNQYARDSLLTPLEMHNSAWFLDELNIDNLAIGYTYSGGNFVPNQHLGHPAYPGLTLRTTALELANFVNMLLNEGVYNGENILSSEAVDSMSTVQNPNWSYSYGIPSLGLFQREDFGDRTVWGHNGGSDAGYAAHFYFCKGENSGIVITTNSEQYVDPIVEYLFDYADSLITNIPARSYKEMSVMNIYPNPTNNLTSIEFEKSVTGNVTLSIYNIRGQEEYIVFRGKKERGTHTLKWDSKDFPSGIYFIKLQTDEGISTQKVIKQ
jgi:CubicO group peptidase (beta-lactamase class C family)